MGEHEPAPGSEDVELDEVDAVLERRLDGRDRVRGCERGRAAMADLQERAVSSKELHGTVGSGVSSNRPPRAAYSRIMRSVIHSTGARSSVHGSAEGAAGRMSRPRSFVR